VIERPEQLREADKSNGWEAFSQQFIGRSHLSTVGVAVVQSWADALPPGSRVLDLGCGPGTPRAKVLVNGNFALHAIDAAPSLVNAYRARFPKACVACESVEESSFFGETFDGVMAWGLLFLLGAEAQRALFHRVAIALRPGGTFLFTASRQAATWADASTKQQSVSLGGEAYMSLLDEAGLILRAEYDDEGRNHYYDAIKPR
jgi:cyclopropane fatty-acyl-phospholipid synthase-like methyltransferase